MLNKIMLLATVIGTMAITGKSQELGARFGGLASDGGGNVALDAVFVLGEFSRIHADGVIGVFEKNYLGIDVLYDFFYQPVGDLEGFDWYIGLGPGVRFSDNYFGLGALSEVGIEYHFEDAPIALGVDLRPTLWIIEDTHFDWGGLAFNLRYDFSE